MVFRDLELPGSVAFDLTEVLERSLFEFSEDILFVLPFPPCSHDSLYGDKVRPDHE